MTQFRVTMLEDDANPHAEDGVLFSSSLTQDLEPKWGSHDRRERALSLPNVLPDEQTTQCVSQPAVRVEVFRDELHEDCDSGKKTHAWNGHKDADARFSAAASFDETRHERSGITPFPSAFRHPFSDYFAACVEPNLYRLSRKPETPWGSFAGLLALRAQNNQLLSVFNLTQIQRHETEILNRRYRDRRLSYISKTMLAGTASISESDLSLLEACTGCDGLICLGSPERIDPEELLPFANSFSYPSLFGEHMKDLRSPVRHFLLGKSAWVLFEWSAQGPLGLFV